MRTAYITLLISLITCFSSTLLLAQHTFSIVAVDPATGEVGSAGASCLDDSLVNGGVLIISDLLPGKGAIHTQALYHPINKANARSRMQMGNSPSQIITWLQLNDAQTTPEVRQYGIVDFKTPPTLPRVAAFTGDSAFNYKGHLTGATYAIQGNILLGPQVLDSMEARFNNTQGSLATRLMATLQGANIPGADARCLSEGVSSLSAFIRVAKPGDTTGTFYLDLAVTSTPFGVEPIDSLQVLFNDWKAVNEPSTLVESHATNNFRLFPNPGNGRLYIQLKQAGDAQQLSLYNMNGQVVFQKSIHQNDSIDLSRQLQPGLYLYRLSNGAEVLESGKLIIQ